MQPIPSADTHGAPATAVSVGVWGRNYMAGFVLAGGKDSYLLLSGQTAGPLPQELFDAVDESVSGERLLKKGRGGAW